MHNWLRACTKRTAGNRRVRYAIMTIVGMINDDDDDNDDNKGDVGDNDETSRDLITSL